MKTTMRHLGLLLVLPVVSALAQEAAAPSIGEDNPAAKKPSPAVTEQLAAAMPKYQPAKPVEKKSDSPIGVPGAITDPDVLELPKMTVRQQPRPRLRLQPDAVFSTKEALGADFAKRNFTPLDRGLNKYTIPLFGRSLEERAYDDYQRQQKEELNADVLQLSNALKVADPAEAKALRDAAAKP